MIGRTISHYRIIEKLGEGGMGIVWKAEDTRLQRTVALKFLTPAMVETAEAKERFLAEARAAAALDHPHIGVVHEIGETDEGQLFIAMAYYGGGSLKERIAEGPIPPMQVVTIVHHLAEALAEAHAHRILHRDIKPANVMLDERGTPRLVDFGLAKSGDMGLTRTGQTLGTLHYMAPELLQGLPASPGTDLWALSVLLYEMLTGEKPFQGDNEGALVTAILNGQQSFPLPKGARAIPGLEGLLTRSLQRDPAKRSLTVEAFAASLATCLPGYLAAEGGPHGIWARFVHLARTRPILASTLSTVLALAILAFLLFYARPRWQQSRIEREIADIDDRIEAGDYYGAWLRLRDALAQAPDHPALQELSQQTSACFTDPIKSQPEGALIEICQYAAEDTNWISVGRTPLNRGRIPSYTTCRLRLQKEGFAPFDVLFFWPYTTDVISSSKIDVPLLPEERLRPGMSVVQSWPDWNLPDFLMDRTEVTNKAYQRFVDSGGYEEDKYWQVPMVRNGESLSLSQALIHFRDQDGRPGPAGWQGGRFPEGTADYPVTGISWFEAMAYSEYVGKDLPTNTHWSWAAGFRFAAPREDIALYSNMSGEGLEPVGNQLHTGYFGLHDMAGNVREWCVNAVGDQRLVRGGAYNDVIYTYSLPQSADPWERSGLTGFRCVDYLDTPEELLERLRAPFQYHSGEFRLPEPADQRTFEDYLDWFDYDQDADLGVAVSIDDTSSTLWTREYVILNAPYEGRPPLGIHILIPRGQVHRPLQTVVYWPGAEALMQTDSQNRLQLSWTDFLIRSGRAVVYPVYDWTYERQTSGETSPQGSGWDSVRYRDWTIRCVKDLRRTIDYLATREEDFDLERLAYYGFSWGTAVGPIALAVETRLKAALLLSGGFYLHDIQPQAYAVHYAPRVQVPVLFLTGESDLGFPRDSSQKPFFEALGGDERSRWEEFEGAHALTEQKSQVTRLCREWLDRLFGPPNFH